MRLRHIIAALSATVFTVCVTGQLVVAATDIPQFSAPVVDSANILSANVESALNQSLESFRQTSGPQVAVLTVSSTGNQSIEDFSIDVARKWGLGDKTRDDGVLLVIAFDDRTLRIETGSGIEGELTDVEAGRIIDAIIAPQLKAGNPDADALDGASAITSELSAAPGETVAIDANTASTGGSFLSRIFFIAFFLLLAVMFIIRGRQQGFGNVASNVLFVAATAIRNGSNGRGGGFSGGGGGGFSGGGASGSW